MTGRVTGRALGALLVAHQQLVREKGLRLPVLAYEVEVVGVGRLPVWSVMLHVLNEQAAADWIRLHPDVPWRFRIRSPQGGWYEGRGTVSTHARATLPCLWREFGVHSILLRGRGRLVHVRRRKA